LLIVKAQKTNQKKALPFSPKVNLPKFSFIYGENFVSFNRVPLFYSEDLFVALEKIKRFDFNPENFSLCLNLNCQKIFLVFKTFKV